MLGRRLVLLTINLDMTIQSKQMNWQLNLNYKDLEIVA